MWRLEVTTQLSMERCHKRDESIETLYMKTEILEKPRVTPILEGKNRMHGPIDELWNLCFSEELLGSEINKDLPRDEEHGFTGQVSKNGFIRQSTLASTKEVCISSDDRDTPNRVSALETCIPEENNGVLSSEVTPEKSEEKMKVGGRRGRSKRKFVQTGSLGKANGALDTERYDAGLDVQFNHQEAIYNFPMVESCSIEGQSLHVEKPDSLSMDLVEDDFDALCNSGKELPIEYQEDLEVKNLISEGHAVSKLKDYKTCCTTTTNHSTRTCIAREKEALPCQEILEGCGSGFRDVHTENSCVYNLETDNRPHDNIYLDVDMPMHESCKNCFTVPNSGEVVLGSAGRKLLLEHMENLVGGSDKGKATASIHHTETVRSKSYEGNLRNFMADTKAKKRFLECGEGANCNSIADSVTENHSKDVSNVQVRAEHFVQNHPIQGDRQVKRYRDVASEFGVPDGVFVKNESPKKPKKTKILSMVGAPPLSLPLENHRFLPQGETGSPHLDDFLKNSTLKQPEDKHLLLQSSENRSTMALVSSNAPSKLQSDIVARQHVKDSMYRLVEEGASKLLLTPLDANLVSAAFVEQDFFTLNGNKEASSTIQPEEDARVCDICGDAGYEHLLAVCSTCNEGAEHIYCMRVHLMTLPEGNWFCEACKGKQEVADLNKGLCSQTSTLREASEISYRKKTSEQQHFLLSTQCYNNTSDSEGVKIISRNVLEGDKLVNLARGAVNVAVPNKQTPEGADHSQLTSTQTQAQGCMNGKESGKHKSLSPSIRCAALKLPNSRIHSSKLNCRTKNPLNKADCGRTQLASSISADEHVSNLKSQALEISDSKVMNVATMSQSEKTSDHSLKISTTSKADSGSLAVQGEQLIRVASLNCVQSSGELEVPPSLNACVQPENSLKFEDVTLSVKVGGVAREKTLMPSEVFGSTLQLGRNTVDTANTWLTSKFSNNNGASISQLDFMACSSGLVFPRKEPILATYSKHTIADGDFQAPPMGESRKVSKGSPYSSSSSHLRLLPIHAVDPGNISAVSRAICNPIPIRCYRCKETGHAAKDCVRSLSNQALDLRPKVARVTAALLNDPARNPPGNEEGKVLSGSFASQYNREEPSLSGLARPQHIILWQGGFDIIVEGQSFLYDGIQAHPSSKAVKEVYESTRQLPARVVLEEVQASFVPNQPDGGLIALYFKAANLDSYGTYMKLLDHMTKHDLVLRGLAITAELLIFPSNRLPQIEQSWDGEKFLWGLFRKKKLFTPKSDGTLNPWICQNAIPLTSYFTDGNCKIFPKATPMIPVEQNFRAQDSLAVEMLDAADQAMRL